MENKYDTVLGSNGYLLGTTLIAIEQMGGDQTECQQILVAAISETRIYWGEKSNDSRIVVLYCY